MVIWVRYMMAIVVCVLAYAQPATAQYRNNGFSLGGGYSLLLGEHENLQFSGAPMLGGESIFKMMDDHWWFGVRLYVGVRSLLDEEASELVGTMLSVQPGMFIRYVLFTDEFRPYMQLGTTFETLFHFTQVDQSILDVYLPHDKWGTINIRPGIEYVFSRNMAVDVGVEFERMLIWSGDDANTLFISALLLFYI